MLSLNNLNNTCSHCAFTFHFLSQLYNGTHAPDNDPAGRGWPETFHLRWKRGESAIGGLEGGRHIFLKVLIV